jgi:hypothetical protein
VAADMAAAITRIESLIGNGLAVIVAANATAITTVVYSLIARTMAMSFTMLSPDIVQLMP